MNEPLEGVPPRTIIVRIVVFLLATAALIGGMIAVRALGSFVTSRPPSSVESMPVYPGAQTVSLQRAQESPPTDVPWNEVLVQVLKFKTPDAQNEVLAYYESYLIEDGWSRSTPALESGPGNLFEWSQAGLNGPTGLAYRITIDYVAQDDGTAKVTVTQVRYNPF
jgi:hypothetical protein